MYCDSPAQKLCERNKMALTRILWRGKRSKRRALRTPEPHCEGPVIITKGTTLEPYTAHKVNCKALIPPPFSRQPLVVIDPDSTVDDKLDASHLMYGDHEDDDTPTDYIPEEDYSWRTERRSDYVGRSFFTVGASDSTPHMTDAIVDIEGNGECTLFLTNNSPFHVDMKAGTHVGDVKVGRASSASLEEALRQMFPPSSPQPLSASVMDSDGLIASTSTTPFTDRLPVHSEARVTDLRSMLLNDLDHVDVSLSESEKRHAVSKLTSKCWKAFKVYDRDVGDLGPSHTVKIDTGDAKPIHQRTRLLPLQRRAAVRDALIDLVNDGIIEPSDSPWSSPLHPVEKDGGKSIRLCVDYRRLNEVTIKDKYSIPNIQELIDEIGSRPALKYFTTLDMTKGFHQIRMHADSVQKTTFSSPYGNYQYKKMPFGITNGPPVFQRVINDILGGMRDKGVYTYIDDVIIVSSSYQEHLQSLVEVCDRLAARGMLLGTTKCHFFRDSIQYLGFRLTRDGIRPVQSKVDDILLETPPTTRKGVMRFLGVIGFYRRFIPACAVIATPLTDLLKKDRPFKWQSSQQKAFDTLRTALTTPPLLLRYPRTDKPFVIRTDASDFGLGAVLEQEADDALLHPIMYMSRALSPSERKFTISEKEMLAIVFALRRSYNYIAGSSDITVMTDHQALHQAMQRRMDGNKRIERWAILIAQYAPKIVYRPGKLQAVADYLSRMDWLRRNPIPQADLALMPTENFIDMAAATGKPAAFIMTPEDDAEAAHDWDRIVGSSATVMASATLHASTVCPFDQFHRETEPLTTLPTSSHGCEPRGRILSPPQDAFVDTSSTAREADDIVLSSTLANCTFIMPEGMPVCTLMYDNDPTDPMLDPVVRVACCGMNEDSAPVIPGKDWPEDFTDIALHYPTWWSDAEGQDLRDVNACEPTASMKITVPATITLDLTINSDDVHRMGQWADMVHRSIAGLRAPCQLHINHRSWLESRRIGFDVPHPLAMAVTGAIVMDSNIEAEEPEEPPTTSDVPQDTGVVPLEQPPTADDTHFAPFEIRAGDVVDRESPHPDSADCDIDMSSETLDDTVYSQQLAYKALREFLVDARAQIRDEQLKDPDLRALHSLLHQALRDGLEPEHRSFTLDRTQQALVKIIDDDITLLVVPPHKVAPLIEATHALGHFGVERIYEWMRHEFWWPNMRRDITAVYRSCIWCAAHTGQGLRRTPPMGRFEIPTDINQRVHMDIVKFSPPAMKSDRQNALVMIDAFSKNMEIYPMDDEKATTVCDCIRDWVSRYGVPRTLISDLGRQFTGGLCKDLCTMYGIRQHYTTPFHPAANGQCERANRTIIGMMKKMMWSTNKDWDELIPDLLLFYRAAPHTSTGFSPYFLTTGHVMALPASDIFHAAYIKAYADNPNIITQVARALRVAYAEVYQTLLLRQFVMKMAFDRRKGKSPKFEAGDVVWYYQPTPRKRADGVDVPYKFTLPFRGPFVIVEINDNNAKLLRIDQQTTDKPIRCNLDKLTYVAHELVAASDNIPTWNGREVRYVTSGFELDQIPGSERDRRTRARARLEQ